jgi:hypothetical protein
MLRGLFCRYIANRIDDQGIRQAWLVFDVFLHPFILKVS